MKNKHFKIIVLFLMVKLHFIGCVKDTNFTTPEIICSDPNLVATNTINQVKNMYTFGGATVFDTDIIIEGYVVSNDKEGNIYKSISIQDKPENPTAAIKIAIDETNLYTKFNVGRKIFVKLKGLAIGYNYGSIQLGKAIEGELGRISAFDVNNHIIRTCQEATIVPKKVDISALNDTMLEMLIEIENAQFKTLDLGNAFGNVESTETVNRTLEIFNENCNLSGEVILRNSGYASFKNTILPEGKGSVVAIFSNYYTDYQLYIRSTEDIQFDNPRCDYTQVLTPTITILELKNMYQGSMVEFGVDANLVIEGYVVSTDEFGNFENKLVLQDSAKNPTAGIQLLLDKEAIFKQFNVGDKVYVNLNKLYMDKENNGLNIGFPKGTKLTTIDEDAIKNYIYNSGIKETLVPTEILIADIDNEKYQNTLVKVMNVQLIPNELGKAFTFFTGSQDAIRTLQTCGQIQQLGVFTNGKATFSNQLFPKERGAVIGVLNNYLELRSLNDVQFNESYKICEVVIPKIMITEVADPINNVNARFVELYNAGTSEINLSGWKLNKYVNGSLNVSSSPVDLSGFTLQAGAFLIIANTEYKTMFNEMPAIESTYISGNGDDVYELVDNTGKRIDIFGTIGEDGNGTNWEYLDGRAVRNSTINSPNTTFEISEWTLYSDASNNLISHPNSPKFAPNDYSPNLR